MFDSRQEGYQSMNKTVYVKILVSRVQVVTPNQDNNVVRLRSSDRCIDDRQVRSARCTAAAYPVALNIQQPVYAVGRRSVGCPKEGA